MEESRSDPLVEEDAQHGQSSDLHGSNYIIGVTRADINGTTDEWKAFLGTIKKTSSSSKSDFDSSADFVST